MYTYMYVHTHTFFFKVSCVTDFTLANQLVVLTTSDKCGSVVFSLNRQTLN